jgi:hypothetical protein
VCLAVRIQLNLALRLVHSFEKEDTLWSLPYGEQKDCFGAEYSKLKPLIDFFQ